MGFELIIDRKVKFCWNNIIKFDNELTIGNNETEYVPVGHFMSGEQTFNFLFRGSTEPTK